MRYRVRLRAGAPTAAAAIALAACGVSDPAFARDRRPGPAPVWTSRATSPSPIACRAHLDGLWNEPLGRYEPIAAGGAVTQINANLLVVHATAALFGYQGRVRDDRRARLLARFLTGPLAWTETPLPGTQPWIVGPGWRAAPNNPNQHPVFSVAAADGLVSAYLAREQLGLEPETVAAIRDETARAAASPDFRWPALRLNQFNWPVAVFAADAIVSGTGRSLVEGLANHLDRFLGGAGGSSAGNLGPGLRFRYSPGAFGSQPDQFRLRRVREHRARIFALLWARARERHARAGADRAAARVGAARPVGLLDARRLPSTGTPDSASGAGIRARRCRWRRRLCSASRRHLSCSPRPSGVPGRSGCSTAASRPTPQRPIGSAGSLLPSPSGSTSSIKAARTPTLAASRYAANAMRAVAAGLGSAQASQPPALYSFDPDTGRLAVTTSAYNTAIVAVNYGAFPYGGLDLARLFDGDQNVAADIGGVPPAAFGLEVRGSDGRVRLRTQYGRRSASSHPAPMWLTRAPARGGGVGEHGHAGVRRTLHRPPRPRQRASRQSAGDDDVPIHAEVDRGPLGAVSSAARRHGAGDISELGPSGTRAGDVRQRPERRSRGPAEGTRAHRLAPRREWARRLSADPAPPPARRHRTPARDRTDRLGARSRPDACDSAARPRSALRGKDRRRWPLMLSESTPSLEGSRVNWRAHPLESQPVLPHPTAPRNWYGSRRRPTPSPGVGDRRLQSRRHAGRWPRAAGRERALRGRRRSSGHAGR